jgi:hypothetical protein
MTRQTRTHAKSYAHYGAPTQPLIVRVISHVRRYEVAARGYNKCSPGALDIWEGGAGREDDQEELKALYL